MFIYTNNIKNEIIHINEIEDKQLDAFNTEYGEIIDSLLSEYNWKWKLSLQRWIDKKK